MFKKVFTLLLVGVFLFPTSSFASSFESVESFAPGLEDRAEPLNNRYYYRWERVNTVQLGERYVTVAEFANRNSLNSVMSDGFSATGYLLKEPVPISSFANAAYSKWSAYNYGRCPGKLVFWRGDEVQYEYDRLTGSKAPVDRRMVLSSVQSAYGPNGLEYLGTISYTIPMK